jgi:hypothetical protein
MNSKLAASILFLATVWFAPINAVAADATVAAQAPKLTPLAQINSSKGPRFFFDPGKVSAVYTSEFITPKRKNGSGKYQAHHGPPKTFVLGLMNNPLPIDETPEDFLKRNNIDSKFVSLDSLEGKVYIKVTAITTILEAIGSKRSNRSVQSFIYPGRKGAAGPPWQLTQSLDEAIMRVNNVRIKQDSP